MQKHAERCPSGSLRIFLTGPTARESHRRNVRFKNRPNPDIPATAPEIRHARIPPLPKPDSDRKSPHTQPRKRAPAPTRAVPVAVPSRHSLWKERENPASPDRKPRSGSCLSRRSRYAVPANSDKSEPVSVELRYPVQNIGKFVAFLNIFFLHLSQPVLHIGHRGSRAGTRYGTTVGIPPERAQRTRTEFQTIGNPDRLQKINLMLGL